MSDTCEHAELQVEVREYPWDNDEDSKPVLDAEVRCALCGIAFFTAREARAAGVFDRWDAERRAALDAAREVGQP